MEKGEVCFQNMARLCGRSNHCLGMADSGDEPSSSNQRSGDCEPLEGDQLSHHDLPSLNRPDPPASDSTRLLSPNDLMEIAQGVSDLTIAHEIIMNQNFQLKEIVFPSGSLEHKVKEIVHKLFWDRLRDQLSANPPEHTQAIKLLEEIKEALLSVLLPSHGRLKALIEEVLDMELIHQRAEHGAMDVPQLVLFILDMMAMLCAPIRDKEVQRLRSLTDTVELFKEIFHVLDLMKLDMANFAIFSLRPHLQHQSVEFERGKFQELLDRQPGSLDDTTVWLQKAAAELNIVKNSTSTEINGLSTSPAKGNMMVPSPTMVLNHAYMNLLRWNSEDDKYPETLLLDRGRLQEIQIHLSQLGVIAAILLVTGSVCGSTIFRCEGFVDRLKRLTKVLLEGLDLRCSRLEEALQDIGEQVQQEVGRTLSNLGYSTWSCEKAASLKGQIADIAEEGNPVRAITGQRIMSFLESCLSPQNPKTAQNPAGGLSLIQEELKDIGRHFTAVIQHNRLVFGPYYSRILKKLLLPEMETETGIDSR
ncbi:T-complex protein 11 homolog isoform X2 [Lissotriton helveticus]